MQMDFRPLLLLFLCITFVSVQGAVPRCCLKTSRVGVRLLKKVDRYTMQHSSGLCNIDALVLHYKGKKMCAPLEQRKYLEKIASKMSQF